MSPDVVVNHQHCYICNRAMAFDPDEKACRDECKAALVVQNKKRRQLMYFLYGAMALTLLLLFFGGSRV
jgi:predicted nucleic acid-binding Zn ribbon protein